MKKGAPRGSAPARSLKKTIEFDIDKVEDISVSSMKAPSKHDSEALNAHVSADHELIPLDGKKPARTGWRRMPALTPKEAMARFSAGRNVGVRLRDTDLVIDVDPRNFAEGDDPLVRLLGDFVLKDAPFVLTGGGGRHLYVRKPAEVAIVHGLPNYPGIEFSTVGRFVVAAGSVHPNGKPYVLDDDVLALSLSEAPEATTALLDAIRRPSGAASSDVYGDVTPEQLEKLLGGLDIALYNRRHNDWIRIMMAAHYGTGGAGVDPFVAWSLSDATYADDEEVIRRKWRSLAMKPNGVKLGTLLKALSDAGKGALIEEVLRSPAAEDFPNDIDLPVETAAPAFMTNKGRIEPNYRNTQRAVEAARLGVGFDELSQRAVLRAERLPWTADIERELTDDLIRIVREWVMEQFGFEPKREDLSDVLFALATKNTFNPIVEYLDSLAWDGVHRIDRMFPAYFGAPDGAYECAVGRKLMLAAVRRMRRPGVKFDTVPIVEGRQGSGKTSALRILGGMWHSDAELGRLDGKDSAGALHGVWIMELGELTAMNKAEVENLKAFVTRTEDRYRPPYGKTVKTYPRRCVFVGTTNSASYLRDHTGNRRYLPVSTGAIDLDALARDRDQLWAEAAFIETAGESLTLPSSLWTDAADRQGDRQVDDPWLDRLRLHIGSSLERTRFSSQELLEFALEVPCSRQNQTDAKRVAVLMAKLGWQHKANLRFGKQSMTGYTSRQTTRRSRREKRGARYLPQGRCRASTS
ncbi:VapE domain-containing protein [Shinella sp.]|uniref:VapE domain-containing protein n=1 Tax=Shinella sp. TaxID=1870904 RepID=UPI0039E2DED4